MQKSFLAIQTYKGIIEIVQIDDDGLPEIVRGAFYEEHYQLFLDGAQRWTTEQQAIAKQLAAAIALETKTPQHVE